jgi:hypothetical protein
LNRVEELRHMKYFPVMLAFALLAACGDGPTTDADEAASAGEINASVQQAQNKAEAAKERAGEN